MVKPADVLRLFPLLLLVLLAACSGAKPSGETGSSSRILRLAGLPPDSEIPAPPAAPAYAPFIDPAIRAAANIEASTMKLAFKALLVQSPKTGTVSSDDLAAYYSAGPPKARYFLSPSSGSIVRVEAVPGEWAGIVFNLSNQTWRDGSPDNDHPGDMDAP